MIPYIGDISIADAKVLQSFSSGQNILEFGCGASTQVIAYSSWKQASFTSIDTEIDWINKTKSNLKYLGIDKEVTFSLYGNFKPNGQYDFIFVDGADGLRRPFALNNWNYLKVGGCMGLHDTRRPHDFRNLLEVLAEFHNEVDRVLVNHNHSNISLIQKKDPEPYDNWQITESRAPWQLGYGDPPPK